MPTCPMPIRLLVLLLLLMQLLLLPLVSPRGQRFLCSTRLKEISPRPQRSPSVMRHWPDSQPQIPGVGNTSAGQVAGVPGPAVARGASEDPSAVAAHGASFPGPSVSRRAAEEVGVKHGDEFTWNSSGSRRRGKKKRPLCHRKPGDTGSVAISFANITQFSDKASHWLMHNDSQICFAVETHWSPRCNWRGSATIRDFAREGWEVICGEPQPSTSSSLGTWGGVLAIARKHLDFQPLAGACKLPTRLP